MLPFSQRERKHTQNFQFTTCASLQRKTTGCATHSRASSLEVEGKKKKKKTSHFTRDHDPRKSSYENSSEQANLYYQMEHGTTGG